MPKSIIAAIAILIAISGCNRTETKKTTDVPKKLVPFSESMFTGITPTVDGGAYAIGYDSGLWYLRGSEAIKIQFPGLPADESDLFFLGLQIVPLADGGVYAYSSVEHSVWYLREGAARKVVDVPALTSKPLSSGLNAFPLYVTEREKRLEAEKKLEERSTNE